MWRVVVTLLLWVLPQQSFAISRVEIHAQTITYDQQATAYDAHATIDLKHHAVVDVQAKKIEYSQFEVRNALLHLDHQANAKISASAEVKQKQDKQWAKAKLLCVCLLYTSYCHYVGCVLWRFQDAASMRSG